MKILYLITKSNWGGAQRYVYDLATNFSSHGHDVCVGTGGKGELVDRLKDSGIRTHSFSSLVRDVSFIEEIKTFKDMYVFIKKEKPGILHLNSSKAAGIGALIGRILSVPLIVFTVHGAPFREDRSYSKKRLIYFFTWVTCLLSHKIITVSKKDESDITQMAFVNKKVTTIYLGITYDPPKRTVPKEKKVRILTIGDLTNNKGHMYGLEAISLLKKRGVPFIYHIIGEGEDREKLEEYIAMKQLGDVASLLGYQDARQYLHEYDVYFLPSIKEGLPFVLLEAGKACVPVVATITGGVPEIIRHEDTGLLAQPKDSQTMSFLLEKIITDRHFGKKLAQNLHAHVVQHFSYAQMIVNTTKVYGLIERKK